MSKPRPPLTDRTPKCFRDRRQWLAYKKPADFLLRHGKENGAYTYCTDCTPEYKAAMLVARRCAYPGTVFIHVGPLIVGKRP